MNSFNFNEFKTAIKPILTFYKCKNYHISYFGGEPLMNWDIIEKSLPQFSKDPDCKSIVLISNGLLLDPTKVDFLKTYKCGLSWSFDGLWSFNRPLVSSQTTENTTIVENSETKTNSLKTYESIIPLTLQLTSSCKVMVQPNCFDTLVDNLKYFMNKGIRHPDFSLVRDAIYLSRDIKLYRIKCKELADFIIQTNQNVTKVGDLVSVGFFTLYTLDTLAAKLYGKRKFGCFVGSNGIMYAYDGSIWPCERFRSVNKLKLYDSNTKVYDFQNLKKLKEISKTHNIPKCQSCELFEYCNTGCTFSELRESKNLNLKTNDREPVDSVCELFKITYKNALYIFENAGKIYQDYILKQL